MRRLKLISNRDTNHLDDVGSIEYSEGKIFINLKPYCRAVVERASQKVTLLETSTSGGSVSGQPQVGDTYAIGFVDGFDEVNNPHSLVIKVVEDFEEINSHARKIEQNRKLTLAIGVLLLALLGISVFFGIKQKKSNDLNEKGEKLILEAEQKLDESIKLLSTDRQKSKTLFLETKDIVIELQTLGYKNEKLDLIIKTIEEKEIDITQEIKTNLIEFLDLSLQIDEYKGDYIVATGDEMFVYSKMGVVQVNAKTKKASISTSSDKLDGTNSIVVYDKRLFIAKNDGIYELTDNNRIKVEDDFTNSINYIYAGNLYKLDKSNNKIYRFPASSTGFGSSREWLAPGVEVDLSNTVDLAIDGSIWILSSNGKISKFTNGNSISLVNLIVEPKLTKPSAIYTNEKLEFVYILEPNEKRVIVLEKNGRFKMQYLSQEIQNAKDLYVDEVSKRLILLIDSKLMYIDLI